MREGATTGIGTNGDEAPTSDLSRALEGAATVSASASADLTAAGAPAALAGDATVSAAATGDLTTSAVPITVVTDVDAGNIDPATVTIANAASSSPTVTVAHRSGAGAWRHFLFAVEGAQGKTPTFRMTLAGRAFSSVPFTADYRPVWTTDFVTWTRAPSRTVGGTYLEWQFTDPLPAGRVYIANMPLGRQADAVSLASYLLASHASVASPTGSADAGGVYDTSPAENDDLGRAVGANPQYAIQLQWGGATTDGKRKRELVMIAGIHSAGEAHSWPAFVACVEWMLSDASSAAIDFRANWNVRLYFNATPNGLRGGSARVNFRSATDPNRTWVLSGASALSEITALRSAIEADTGGRCDVFWSWHGAANTSTPINVYLKPSDYSAGTRRPIAQALIDTITTLSGNTPRLVDVDTETSGNYTTTDMWWGEAKLGAALFGDVELQARGDSSHAEAVRVGEVWARTLQSLDAQGLFVPPIELAGASIVATTSTGSITTGIPLLGAASSLTLADGTLTVQIRLRSDALASAIAAAGLTTAIQLAAAAQAGAQASGTLTTAGAPASLEGNATAQALATGSITTIIRLDAQAIASVVGSGTLTAPGAPSQLEADATVLAIAAGGLTTGIQLRGAAASVVHASGTLDVALTFEAQAFAAAMATGVLSTQIRMEAAAVASALARADLTGGMPVVPPTERTIPVRAQTRVVPVRAQTRLIPA